MEIKKTYIEGECKWAHLLEPTTDLNGNEMYSVDIEISDETIDEWRKMGLPENKKIKEDDGKKWITLKRPVLSAKGRELPAPHVFDTMLEPVTEGVGNGSIIKIRVAMIPFDNKFGSGITPRIEAVQVLKHEKYDFNPTEGFEVVDDLPF